MRKEEFLSVVFILLSLLAKANHFNQESLDSLRTVLQSETKHAVRAQAYEDLASLYSFNNDSALHYSHDFLNEAMASKDSFLIADAYYDLANYHYYYNYDSTLFYAKKHLEWAYITTDTTWIADAYNLLAYAYSQKGEISASLESYEQALNYYQLSGDSSMISACYINIGYTVSFSKEQVSSLNYFLKGLNVATTISDTSLMSDAYYNIAYYYERIKDYHSAFNYYKKSLDFSLSINQPDSNSVCLTYSDLAGISHFLNLPDNFNFYMKLSHSYLPKTQNSYDKANLYYSYFARYNDTGLIDSAQHYCEGLDEILNNNSFDILKAYALQQKGRLNLLENNYQQSISYFNQSITLFSKHNSIESFSETYGYIAKAYAALNQFENAYIWLQKSLSISDTLNLDAVKSSLAEFEQEKSFEAEMQRNKLEMQLDQELIRNANFKIKTKLRLSMLGLILFGGLIIFYSFYQRRTKKNNQLLSTKNKLIEEQKTLMQQQLLQLLDSENKLMDLNRTKDKFFSIIAHDLRNPFHTIISLTNLLLQKEDIVNTNYGNKILANLNKTASYGSSLLENLLEWSKTQTGRIVPKPEPIDLVDCIQQIITDNNAMLLGKNIKVKLETQLVPKVSADKNMLRTIIRNLLHNAIKFSYENSEVIIRTSLINDKVQTQIIDCGIGIGKEEIAKLFTIDRQVRHVGTNKESGSGLGLVICKEFVEKNKGEIAVESEYGKGSTFSFTLPAILRG